MEHKSIRWQNDKSVGKDMKKEAVVAYFKVVSEFAYRD
jgi:hypothetical protein